MKKLVCILLILFACVQQTYSQSLPVDAYNLEEVYRLKQLKGQTDSSVSFMIRPLLLALKGTPRDSTGRYRPNDLTLLPFTWQQQLTTHHPYGWNDGVMIPAKGYQTMLSGGFYGEYGPLTVQVKPELVIANNSSFEEFPEKHYDVIWKFYYNFYNNIDMPVRFGDEPFIRLSPGQSSVRFNYKKLSFGVSTENLWWGPGIRNSLLMSNSAPGFAHLTLNTREPIQTSIGSFEGQLIAGRLEGSGFTPPRADYIYRATTLYQPKPKDWRYLSGITMTYQPKWLPGLFLGFARTSQLYSKDLNTFGDYLPFFSSYSNDPAADRPQRADQYTSVFMRWLMPKANAEVYFEYGHDDQQRSLSEFIKDPDQGRAYVFGVQKLFPIGASPDEGILAGFETTQLSQNDVNTVRNARGWYADDHVRHGYTNRGESLGAGAGPGAEVQTLNLHWVKDVKKLGLQIERFVHNQDFFYYAYEPSKDYRRHWTDISVGVNGRWDYKKYLFNASLNFTKSLNYGWYLEDNPDPNQYFTSGKDARNLQFQVGVTYRFD